MNNKKYRYFSKVTVDSNNIKTITVLRCTVLYKVQKYRFTDKLVYSITSDGYVKYDYKRLNLNYEFNSVEFNDILNNYTEHLNYDNTFSKLREIVHNNYNTEAFLTIFNKIDNYPY